MDTDEGRRRALGRLLLAPATGLALSQTARRSFAAEEVGLTARAKDGTSVYVVDEGGQWGVTALAPNGDDLASASLVSNEQPPTSPRPTARRRSRLDILDSGGILLLRLTVDGERLLFLPGAVDGEVEVTQPAGHERIVKEPLACSFCAKPRDQVKKLIAGPGVFICNECIDLCNEMLAKPKPG